MTIYFTFQKGVHLGAAFRQLKTVFKTAELEKNVGGVNEIAVSAGDFEKNKNQFPPSLLKKIIRCRSGALDVLDWLNGYRSFDNQIEICEDKNTITIK